MKKTKWLLTLMGLLITVGAFAAISDAAKHALNRAGGALTKHQLGTLIENAEDTVPGTLTLENAETVVNSTDDTVQVASNDAALVFSLYSPLTTDGDASLQLRADASTDAGDDWEIQHDGATNDLLFRNDKGGSLATFYTFSEDGDVSIAGTTPKVTVGDAGAEDSSIVFDGNAQDFHIGLEDATDDLHIGLGAALGTTPAISINESLQVTIPGAFVANGDAVLGGTTPLLTVGDAGEEDAAVKWDGNVVDYSLGVDDSVDDLVLSLGSALGTTNRMAFDGGSLKITLGDASEADLPLIWDGAAQDYNIGLDDSTDDLVIGLGSAPGTTDAIRIDENQNTTVVQELIGLGTDAMYGFLQKSVASTTTQLTAADCGKTFVSDSADVLTLPQAAGVIGCRITFIVGNVSNFDINPTDADEILLLTNSVDDAIRADAVGESVVLEAIAALQWAPVGAEKGTWTDID
jgi:hypothetical protein